MKRLFIAFALTVSSPSLCAMAGEKAVGEEHILERPPEAVQKTVDKFSEAIKELDDAAKRLTDDAKALNERIKRTDDDIKKMVRPKGDRRDFGVSI